MSVRARHPLHVIIMAAGLLHATGGRMEQMEQQMGQMSDMQMYFLLLCFHLLLLHELHQAAMSLAGLMKDYGK